MYETSIFIFDLWNFFFFLTPRDSKTGLSLCEKKKKNSLVFLQIADCLRLVSGSACISSCHSIPVLYTGGEGRDVWFERILKMIPINTIPAPLRLSVLNTGATVWLL